MAATLKLLPCASCVPLIARLSLLEPMRFTLITPKPEADYSWGQRQDSNPSVDIPDTSSIRHANCSRKSHPKPSQGRGGNLANGWGASVDISG